jgi:hypothetical protein
MRKILILSAFIWIFGAVKSYAQEESFIAMSIYNFTRYVDWPSNNATNDFIIDIIGHKSVYEKLKDVASGKKVGSQNITVRFLETPNNITQSHILFIGFWQSKDLPKILEKVGNASTLMIGEKDGMIDAGVAINFIIRNNTIKFEIKKANILKYGLTINETLLGLAYKTY